MESAYVRNKGLASSQEEILRNAILELTEIQKKINSVEAYRELFMLLHNDYYVDNYVLLKDLLNPDESPLYKHVELNANQKGFYKKAFENVFDPSLYPNLDYVLNISQHYKSTNQPDLAFYMPYPEDENGVPFTETDIPTYVPTVVTDENLADYGYGYKEENGQWNTYITDDNYALQNATINLF